MYIPVYKCAFAFFYSLDYQREKGMATEQTMLIKKAKDFSYTYVHVEGETDDHAVIIQLQ